MLAFKAFLDDDEFTFFLRLDENIKKSDKSYKIARAKVAEEAKKAGVNFLHACMHKFRHWEVRAEKFSKQQLEKWIMRTEVKKNGER
jgi:hypothetical protein